jgi:hypothetical protein
VKKAAALLLAPLLLLGCRSPVLLESILPADDPRPASLLNSLHARSESVTGVRAAMRLALDAPDLRFRRPQRMALKRPARLRVEILGLFGQIAAVLVTDGADYQLFDSESGELEAGSVTPDLLWRVARVDLTPEEAVSLLIGAPQPLPELSRSSSYLREDGGVAVEFIDADELVRERFEFGALGMLQAMTRWDAAGERIWQASFDDYREVEGTPFAHQVDLKFPRVEAKASLSFKSVSFDPELPDDLFVLSIPAARSRQ